MTATAAEIERFKRGYVATFTRTAHHNDDH